jgi:hypothetical protein
VAQVFAHRVTNPGGVAISVFEIRPGESEWRVAVVMLAIVRWAATSPTGRPPS